MHFYVCTSPAAAPESACRPDKKHAYIKLYIKKKKKRIRGAAPKPRQGQVPLDRLTELRSVLQPLGWCTQKNVQGDVIKKRERKKG